MAKILLGQGVAGLSGSILGTTYSRNSNGAYARNKSIPVNSNTLSQQDARALFASVSSNYRSLTPAQREGWKTAAPNFPYVDVFGQTKTYTGNQLYMKLNMNLAVIGEPFMNNVPTAQTMPVILPVPVIAEYGTNLELALDTPFNVQGGFALEMLASPPVSTSTDFYDAKAMRRIVTIDEGNPVGQNIYLDYATKFGEPQANQKVFVGYRLINKTTGQTTNRIMIGKDWVETT